MLRFLRGARRRLIDTSKARSYLLYATGEVVLVVIGILIALHVNNWSEGRANAERLDAILRDIQVDIDADLRLAAGVLPNGVVRDSILKRAINDEITREEYTGPGGRPLLWAALQYQQFAQNRTAFERLSSYDGIIPVHYSEVLDVLEDLYVFESNLLNSRQAIFRAQIENRHEYLSRTYPWYWRLSQDQRPDSAMLDYYLNNPEYKNFAYRFRSDQTTSEDGEIQRYRYKAASAYAVISGFLGEPVSAPSVPRGILPEDAEAYTMFEGRYEVADQGCCAEFRIRNGVLYLGDGALRHIEGTTFGDLFEAETTVEFRAEADGAHVITLTEDGEVIVLTRQIDTGS